ncbi:hypothetical protein [Bdellovibrio sp. HCB2-146]|uniref:hypothetical protein n=1 Tax=Bdellovibrio sp. HCB2-146 TaxID=3394362 RepID=UPI0039BD4D61
MDRRRFVKGVLSSLGVISVGVFTAPASSLGFVGPRMLRRRIGPDKLYVWGFNYYDALGVTGPDRVSTPVLQTSFQSSAHNWITISPSQSATFMLKGDKTLWAVGTDLFNTGVFGNGTVGAQVSSPIQIGTDAWMSIATNALGALGVKQDGTLWTWGSNRYQTFGFATGSWAVPNPTFIMNAKIGKFDTHKNTTLAINSSDQLYGWGTNREAQLGIGNRNNPSSLVLANAVTWAKCSVGRNSSACIKLDGTLWAWGLREDGSVPDGNTVTAYISTPVMVSSEVTWTHVGVGFDFGIARKSDGTMMGWGYNFSGNTGVGLTPGTHTYSPTLISGTNWASISVGDVHFLALKSDGTLWACGDNGNGQIGNNSGFDTSTPVAIGANTWSQISAGWYHSLGIRTDGTLWGWGLNADGQLGQNHTSNRSSPVRIGTDSNWIRIAAGGYASLGIRSNGTLWWWGYCGEWNVSGILRTSSPIQIGSDTDWQEIKAGQMTFMLQKTNGDLYGLGLGGIDAWDSINTMIEPSYTMGKKVEAIVSTPVQVGTATDWKYVELAEKQAFAIKSDGTLHQWGWIIYDFTDNYSYERYSTPVQAGSATTWKKVVSKGSIHLALQNNGTIWSWGTAQEALGLGNAGDQALPVQISSPVATWTDIAVSQDVAFGIASDGNLYSWGPQDPVRGKTGAAVSTPVNTNTGTWLKVAGGAKHAIGIKNNHTLWGWGWNTDGPLGIGSTADRSTPVQSGSATDWRNVFAGGQKSFGTRW